MVNKYEKDEHLERLWHMKEDGTQGLKDLQEGMGKEFNRAIIDELVKAGMVNFDQEKSTIELSLSGEDKARKLIRAHRLAERMLHDVFGGDFETGACEFEHTITPELVDGICILLGHPRECPHGLSIPQGECCKRAATVTESSVIRLTDLKIGQCARIAYAYSKDDQQLHKMNGLHLRPGVTIKMHQTYPCFVIECEGANIALDENVASNICVWR